MKIYLSRTELGKALSTVFHAISSRTPSKVLEGILVEVDGSRMKLTATDTNMTIETEIAVTAEDRCAFVAPAKLISSIIAKLPEEEVMMEYDEKKNKLRIRSGRSSSEIICFQADEYPKLRIRESDEVIRLNKETVKKIIRKTAFSASTDELNGILTGVLIEIKDGQFRMVAVDAFRMTIYNDEIEDQKAAMTLVIPARMINELSKILTDGDDPMTLAVSEQKAVFCFDNNRVTLNTLNGRYIDYKRIIKADSTISIRVQKEELVRSIDRAALLAQSQNNNLIRFSIDDELIEINSLSDEGNIEEKVEVIKKGDDLKIGFNSRYLIDIFRAIDDEEIMMYMKDSISPCIIKPLTGEKYLYLVLPIRIN
ncbi:MAG: DNA polymerase III subunit beta [Mogibacterium sp.]|nr:DNA polymerase III subunit beta [Mogibacterium sp.]